MPIMTPHVDTYIAPQQYASPAEAAMRQANLEALLKGKEAASAMARLQQTGEQEKEQIGLKGQQTQEQDKLQALLKGQNEEKQARLESDLKKQQVEHDAAIAQNMSKTLGTGASVHAGMASAGTDPTLRNARVIAGATANEAKTLQSIWGKDGKALDDGAAQVESGLQGITSGTPPGDKTAIAAITRLADGRGQRMTQAQLMQMTPKSAQGDAQHMLNYWAGRAESGLAPPERTAVRQLLMQHAGRLQNEFGDMRSEFQQQAPALAPMMSQSGQLNSYADTFGSKTKAAFDRIQKLGQTPAVAPGVMAPDQAPAGTVPQIAQKAGNAVGGGLQSLFGAGAPKPSVAAPPANPSAQAPGGFDPDAYLKGQ